MAKRPKSRVLVLSAHRGQVDRRILAEVNALAGTGREITFVSVPAEISAACIDSRVRVLMPAFESRQPARNALKRTLRRMPRKLFRMAKDVSYYFGKGPYDQLGGLFSSLVENETFDAIHCHDLCTLPAAIELKETYSPRAKLIYDAHELFPFQFEEKSQQAYWYRTESTAIHHADAVITVNDSIGRAMKRLYRIKQPTILFNSYGLPTDDAPAVSLLSHFRCDVAGTRVLYQGNLSRGRNLPLLIEAFGRIRGDATLFMLGDGELAGALKAQVHRNGRANVFLGPWVSQEKLLPLVSQADLGIIPYPGDNVRNSKYCTPNKLFEYIEAQIPICASDLPELSRIIETYNIGRTYSMRSADLIARAIDNCVEQYRNGAFSSSSLAAAREDFAWKKQERLLIDLYNTLGV